jgi:hypothetical protein
MLWKKNVFILSLSLVFFTHVITKTGAKWEGSAHCSEENKTGDDGDNTSWSGHSLDLFHQSFGAVSLWFTFSNVLGNIGHWNSANTSAIQFRFDFGKEVKSTLGDEIFNFLVFRVWIRLYLFLENTIVAINPGGVCVGSITVCKDQWSNVCSITPCIVL